MSNKNQKKLSHKSYGLIQLSRCSGYQELFGTDIPLENYMSITISEAELNRHDDVDKFYPTQNIIRIAISPIQFAEFLTNINNERGVPCTIQRLQGEKIEFQPYQNRFEASQEMFKTSLDDNLSKRYINDSIDIIEKSNLPQKTKVTLISNLKNSIGRLQDEANFLTEQFQENSKKIVVSAKAEISAHKEMVINTLGNLKLQELISESQKVENITEFSEQND